VDNTRVMASGRLRRLHDELIDEGTGIIEATSAPNVLVDELDYALRPPRHERRLPTYGAIVLPSKAPSDWSRITGLTTTLSRTVERDDQDTRRYADGLVSWTIRESDGVTALAVFDRAAGSERDVVVLAEATGAIIVQRRPDSDVRVVGSFGVARWDGSSWHVEPPFGSWLEQASCGLNDPASDILDRVLRFAVHDLGAAGIGALMILGGNETGEFEQRLAAPPPLRLDRPTDLGPLRHVLTQVDGATVIDSDGVLRALGVRLIPSSTAETSIDAVGGTRHTSARRYSFDDPSAIVIAVSESGPVTVFRDGRIVGRSPDDPTRT
jgi:hypothetical protein